MPNVVGKKLDNLGNAMNDRSKLDNNLFTPVVNYFQFFYLFSFLMHAAMAEGYNKKTYSSTSQVNFYFSQ